MTRSHLRMIVASMLAMVLIVLATGCSRTAASSGDGLSPAERNSAGSGSSASASDAAAVKKRVSASASGVVSANGASGTKGTKGTSGTKGTKGTSGTGGTSGKPGTSSKPGTVVKPVVVAGMKVLILFWNDTSSKSLKGTEIVIGQSAFKPNTSGATDRGTLAAVPYGKTVQIVVYPDGRGGKKISVPLTVSKEMIPNSEQDAIHVAISDGSVRILGNAISNVDQASPRF